MDITNNDIAAALEQLAREMAASVDPSDQPADALALGIATGAIMRIVRDLRNPTAPYFMQEIPELYDVAREACHACGIPWTDPRTGKRYPPPPRTKH